MVGRERAQNADARIFKETWKFKENAEKDNMEHRVQTNSTTFPDGACPELKKLDLDTFKCPFCHRTGSYPGLVAHLQSHQRSLVKYGGYNVYKCHLDCVASSHYHCGLCPRIIGRKEMFFNHFKNCCTQLPTTLASMATAPIKKVTPTTAPMTATTRSRMIPATTAALATTSTAPVMAPATTSTTPVMAPATTSTAPVMAPATTSTAPVMAPAITPVMFPATTSTTPVMAPATTPVMAPATTSTTPVMAPATTSTAPVMAPATTPVMAPTAATTWHNISTAPKMLMSKRKNTTCCFCSLQLLKKNLKMHIQRHHSSKTSDITANRHLKSECIDKKRGIFAVSRTFKGPGKLIFCFLKD